jgi:hypothetical protein
VQPFGRRSRSVVRRRQPLQPLLKRNQNGKGPGATQGLFFF